MSEFKVEKKIPMPANVGRGAKLRYPFPEMNVGDSFFAAVPPEKIRPAAAYYGIRNSKKFSVIKVEGGFRVWRVK